MKKATAAEDLSAKKKLALQVIDRLKTEYPDADCTLDYDQAWETVGQCPAGGAMYGCESQYDRSDVI